MSTDTIAPPVKIPAGTWKLDPAHTKLGFAVKHMGVSTVRGEFRDFDGTIEIGDDITESRAYGTAKAASVDTGEETRDNHLRSADFFDAEQYPELTYESTRFEILDEETIKVVGNLTIHGVTREVELEAEIVGADIGPEGEHRFGLEATGKLSRKDYKMKFNAALGSGNAVVGDKVKLQLDLEAIRLED